MVLWCSPCRFLGFWGGCAKTHRERGDRGGRAGGPSGAGMGAQRLVPTCGPGCFLQPGAWHSDVIAPGVLFAWFLSFFLSFMRCCPCLLLLLPLLPPCPSPSPSPHPSPRPRLVWHRHRLCLTRPGRLSRAAPCRAGWSMSAAATCRACGACAGARGLVTGSQTGSGCATRTSWHASAIWPFRPPTPMCGSARWPTATCRPPGWTHAGAASTATTLTGAGCAIQTSSSAWWPLAKRCRASAPGWHATWHRAGARKRWRAPRCWPPSCACWTPLTCAWATRNTRSATGPMA